MLELNKIYNMDCVEYMKTLSSQCIDLIIVDTPQYNVFGEIYKIMKFNIGNVYREVFGNGRC